MPVEVKSATLWRKEVENQPGTLAGILQPFAEAGADLQVVMGYRFPGNEARAAIELYPVTGRSLTKAAQAAGLVASPIPALVVQGDNKPGLGHAIAASVAASGINVAFMMAQVVGRRYAAVIGFDTADDAKKAGSLIKKVTAAAPKKRPAKRS